MARKKWFKMTAAAVSALLLANTCMVGLSGVSAEDAAAPAAASTPRAAYIDNSNLLPAYLANDKVALEAIDGSGAAMTPEWVKSLIVTELNVERASTDGKFSGMEKALQLLAEEGVNGVWLTPINNDTLVGADGTQTATKGNRYSNFGPDTVSCTLTGKTDYSEGWAEVKQFVDLAHSYNIRVFLDIVTWGLNEQAPIYTDGAHADWFGSYKSEWNGYLFDWSNAKATGLYDWFKAGMLHMITATGADGFRADCGSSYAGSAFFRDVRETLLTNGYKIAMFSEHPEQRDGTFDFEEHSYIDSSYNMYQTHTFYTANNIVDAVKNASFTGTGKYYSSLISCHDYGSYTTANDLITLGYASIGSPYIPIWYFGEEWNNTKTEGKAQLYQNIIQYGQIDQNREYYETVKAYIRVRRTYRDIFESYAANSADANICKVTTSGSGLYQAYARYSADCAVLVVPNNSEADARLTVQIPDMGLDSTKTYRLINALTGEVILNSCALSSLTSFSADVAAGGLGMYAIEKTAKVKSAYFYETQKADGDTDPRPAYVLQLTLDSRISKNPQGASYWYKNLQQYMSAAQNVAGYDYTLHNQFAGELRDNLVINGVTLGDALEQAGQTSTHVLIGGANGDVMEIRVVQDNNPYGISFDTPFEIEIKEGVTVSGYGWAPCKIALPGLNNNSNYKIYHDTVKLGEPIYRDGRIVLAADRNLESAADDVGAAVAGKIQINGAAVDGAAVSVLGNTLVVDYAAAADFDLYLANGVILNGYELSPTRYQAKVTGSPGSDVRQQGEYVTAADSADGVTPYYGYIQRKLLSEVGCTDPGHGTGYHYVIHVVMQGAGASKSIQYTNTNFNITHLQYYKEAEINPYILINGKSIADSIAENGGNLWKSIHIRAGSANTLQIIIPEEENIFGLDIAKPFTITFAAGLTLNQIPINPRTFTCPGHDFANPVEYGGAYFSKVTTWSDEMVVDGNATAEGSSLDVSSVLTKNVCASHDSAYGETQQWLVQIPLNKDVYDVSNFAEKYYSRHLHCTGSTDVRTNFSGYEDFRQKVLINGKTISELYALSTNRTDWTTFLHLEVTEDNVLRIMVPKDNTYGFDGDGRFTIQVKSGLVMNGVNVNPFLHTHVTGSPQSVTFTAPKVTLDTATKAELINNYVYIYLKDMVTKPKMKLNGQADSLLQDMTRSSTDALIELSQALCSHIRINGERIGEGNVRAKHFASAMVQTYNGDGNVLRFQFDANNVYQIAPANRATIEITEGLVINGYAIEPAVYYYDGNGNASLSQGYWAAISSYTGGAISPRNPDNGGWITNQQNTLKAGDTVRVKVQPDQGYQLKAGSLTYTYWYRGELVTKQITRFATSDSTGDYYDFESPDVIGVIGAEFVAVNETVNFATLGAQNRTSGAQGLRFVNRLYLDNVDLAANTVAIGGEVCAIQGYGVQIGVLNDAFDWSAAYQAQTEVMDSNDRFLDFSAQVVNLEPALYDTAFAARAYLTYVDGSGVEHTVTTDGVIRSVHDFLH